jgi:hypothetical protein
MMRKLGIAVIIAGITGCASMSLADTTARTLGLSSGDVVTISNDSGNGVFGTKYYTATTKNGDEYNCSIFSSMGVSNPPQCIKRAK